MLTKERIREIQVTVLMEVMLGEVHNTDEVRNMYFLEEVPTHNAWCELVHAPLVLRGFLNTHDMSPYWTITEAGKEFIKRGGM